MILIMALMILTTYVVHGAYLNNTEPNTNNQVIIGPAILPRNDTLTVYLVGGVDNGIDGGVLIYNASSGLPIATWLLRSINQSMNYYVVATTWSRDINLGYTEVSGDELSIILSRGAYRTCTHGLGKTLR